MIRTLLLAAALLAAGPAHAADRAVEGQTPQPAARAGDYAYQLFVPRGYDADRRQLWPLLVFLHGSGERGDDLELVKKNGPPKVLAAHPGTPMLVASPQLEAGGDWDTGKLDRLLADLRRRYRVDSARIYLTGLSLGGMGSWRWAAARPELFAAVVPVAGRSDPATACRLKDLPVWAFHGDGDPVVPPSGSFAMVEALRACGPTVPPRLTVYPDTGHPSWEPAYDDPALWRWIGEQRRTVPAP